MVISKDRRGLVDSGQEQIQGVLMSNYVTQSIIPKESSCLG